MGVSLGPNKLTIPTGTSDPASGDVGDLFYNITDSALINYGGTEIGWQKVNVQPPKVTNISGTINEDDSSTITITGENFSTGSVVSILGNGVGGVARELTTTYVSEVQLTAQTDASNVNYVGGQSFDVKVTNVTGLSNTLDNVGVVDRDPIWSTASGTIIDGSDLNSLSSTVSASDPDGTSVTYSIASGSLPGGMSLNSTSGLISGNPANVNGDTTYPITVRATSNEQPVDRAFSIIVRKSLDGASSSRAAPSARYIKELTGTSTDGYYWIQTPDMSSPQQIFCDMNNEGGGWMLLFINQGGNVNMTQSGTFYDNLSNTSHTSSLSPRRYNGSTYAWGRTQVWIDSKSRSIVNMMKTYNMYNSSNSIVDYNMNDTNTNGINHTNSRVSRQVYDILDMGSSVSPAHIYSTSYEGSPTTFANAVTLYVDGGNYGGSGGTYNYGSTDRIKMAGSSRGFANGLDTVGQPSSNYMRAWGARHWIAYNNSTGYSRVRCQYVCWGSEQYLLEVGMWMKENVTWQP